MKIKKITAHTEDLELTKPYEIAFTITDTVQNAFVEIELANGIVGLGAASPSKHVLNETIEDLKNNLTPNYLQQWEGRDIRHFRQIIAEVKTTFPKHSATQTALDIALHDAFGKYLDIPIVQFYGQKIQTLPTSVTIGICTVEETLQEAQEHWANGFSVLKVKTGKSVEEDVERCSKLREKYGKALTIRVDANQGYSLEDTLQFYKQTQQLNIELIEQPMPVGTEAAMRTLPPTIRTLIACDESLKNATSALHLAQPPQVGGIFNIKLMKCGGVLGAMEIATIAQAANIDLFWGCFDESIISISAALHAALACPHTKYLDLDGSLDLGRDIVTGGFHLENGQMRVTDGPGFGFKRI